MKNILVAGAGYVGLSMATLLCKYNKVVVYDINEDRIKTLKQKKSPLNDKDIQNVLSKTDCDMLRFTSNINETIDYSDDETYVIISTPTNYDERTGCFDTSSIESVISYILATYENFNGVFIIKSTIPIGYTRELIKKTKYDKILFSPEFLREGKALYDNLHPSRIVVGFDTKSIECYKYEKYAKTFASLLQNATAIPANKVIITGLEEAESIKLFANTYLATRVAYFNELDTFAINKNLNTKDIIDGVCSDPRIGEMYNNPSFGYGGYCLPKDTKQLLSNFKGIKENMFKAVVDSNETRKNVISYEILKYVRHISGKTYPTIGIYNLAMKSGSDNCRSSAIFDIVRMLKELDNRLNFIVYDKNADNKKYAEHIGTFTLDLVKFKKESDIIITNRFDNELENVKRKVFTRDIYNNN